MRTGILFTVLLACGLIGSGAEAPLGAEAAAGAVLDVPVEMIPEPEGIVGVRRDVPRAYARSLDALAVRRAELARAWRGAQGPERDLVLAEARAEALEALTTEVVPAWIGTRWAMNGTTQKPKEGRIACGYFVSTVLRDAGFRVDRVLLAQQPAENIVRTLVPAHRTWRFRGRQPAEVVASVARQGEGLYVVGLDKHVGLLSVDAAGEVEMCHSSRTRGGRGVVCEDAASTRSMRSRYHVVGRLLEAPMLEAWLADAPIRTVTRR